MPSDLINYGGLALAVLGVFLTVRQNRPKSIGFATNYTWLLSEATATANDSKLLFTYADIPLREPGILRVRTAMSAKLRSGQKMLPRAAQSLSKPTKRVRK